MAHAPAELRAKLTRQLKGWLTRLCLIVGLAGSDLKRCARAHALARGPHLLGAVVLPVKQLVLVEPHGRHTIQGQLEAEGLERNAQGCAAQLQIQPLGRLLGGRPCGAGRAGGRQEDVRDLEAWLCLGGLVQLQPDAAGERADGEGQLDVGRRVLHPGRDPVLAQGHGLGQQLVLRAAHAPVAHAEGRVRALLQRPGRSAHRVAGRGRGLPPGTARQGRRSP